MKLQLVNGNEIARFQVHIGFIGFIVLSVTIASRGILENTSVLEINDLKQCFKYEVCLSLSHTQKISF